MPHDLLPCSSAGPCTFCPNGTARLDIACEIADFDKPGPGGGNGTGLGGIIVTDFFVIPGLISVTRTPNVQRAGRSRYSGTSGLFVAGCSGRREMEWRVTAKWFKDEYLLNYSLIHGGCIGARIVPNAPDIDGSTDITHAYVMPGRIVLDGDLNWDNNSAEEMIVSFTIEALGVEVYYGATSPIELDCTGP